MTEKSSSPKCLKYTLIVLLILKIILSGIYVGLGVYGLDVDFLIAVIFISCGSIFVLLVIYGFFTIVYSNRKLVFTFFIFVIISFSFQFLMGMVLTNISTDANEYELERSYKHLFLVGSADSLKRDKIQSKFKCCGWKGALDYSKSGNLMAPLSCCKEELLLSCNTYVSDLTLLYKDPCELHLNKLVNKIVNIESSIFIGFAWFDLIILIFVMVLLSKLKKNIHPLNGEEIKHHGQNDH